MGGYSQSLVELWNDWQVSSLIVFNLLLQLLLLFTAHSRKTKPLLKWRVFFWVTHIGSKFVATYCLGILSHASITNKDGEPNMQLQAIWAAVLLFHLGGLDNFTALTLEDNQLWLRQAAVLFTQAVTTAYIFVRYYPGGGYRGLLPPFILVYSAALLKCFEQAWALKKGRMAALSESILGDPDPGPDYADTMDRFAGKLKSGWPATLDINNERFLNKNLNGSEIPKPPVMQVASQEPVSPICPSGLTLSAQDDNILNTWNQNQRENTPVSETRNIITAHQFYCRSLGGNTTENVQSEHYLDPQIRIQEIDEIGTTHNLDAQIRIQEIEEIDTTPHREMTEEVEEVEERPTEQTNPEAILSSSSTTLEFPASMVDELHAAQLARILNTSEALSNIVPVAYDLFKVFKLIFVDGIFSFKDRKNSQEKFLEYAMVWAFKVIETELNFAYDLLYTKASVSRTGRGLAFRVVSLIFVLLSTILVVLNTVSVTGFKLRHKVISYVLLAGAVLVDSVTLLAYIKSDWSLISGQRLNFCSIFRSNLRVKARWSNLVSQYNLISFCLANRPSFLVNIFETLGLKEQWDEYKNTKYIHVPEELKALIFDELIQKAEAANRANDYAPFTSYRGDWVLEQEGQEEELGWSIHGSEFDESILIWHIATGLCYRKLHNDIRRYKYFDDLKYAQMLSNYMLYVLVVHPLMLSSSTILALKRFKDTSAEVMRHFEKQQDFPNEYTAHEILLGVETVLRSSVVKGDKSKSIIWDGCILAKKLLRSINPENRWLLTRRVWIEMLCYAGINCGGYHHAEQLREGGELLTFACFLMTHLGMAKHYRIELGDATANFTADED